MIMGRRRVLLLKDKERSNWPSFGHCERIQIVYRFLLIFAIVATACYNAMVTGQFAKEQLTSIGYSNFLNDVSVIRRSARSDQHDDNGSVFIPQLNLERVQRRLLQVLGERRFNAASNPSLQTLSTGSNTRKQERQDPNKKRQHYRSTRFELSPDRPLYSSLTDFTFWSVDVSSTGSILTSSSSDW